MQKRHGLLAEQQAKQSMIPWRGRAQDKYV
jgi:hypothetical protein